MTPVLLDTNIYDLLRDDLATREDLVRLVATGQVTVLATPKVLDELLASPFNGVPDWFPVNTPPESVAVLDHWRLGHAVLADGEVYTSHRGASQKVADAIIADSAASIAKVAASDDARFRKRLAELSTPCQVMSYQEFQAWVTSESARRPTTGCS